MTAITKERAYEILKDLKRQGELKTPAQQAAAEALFSLGQEPIVIIETSFNNSPDIRRTQTNIDDERN